MTVVGWEHNNDNYNHYWTQVELTMIPSSSEHDSSPLFLVVEIETEADPTLISINYTRYILL